MFTGIVQEVGRVQNLIKESKEVFINISCSHILKDVDLGDSIAVNGVCLTVSKIGAGEFIADVMPETLARTGLNFLRSGHLVNLEAALTLNSRLGGHLVSGHIDGIGKIKRIYNEGNAKWFEIEAGPELLRYMVMKGSVALDGASLTLVDVGEKTFSVSLIPHTTKVSTLGDKRIGDVLNIECDVLGKYVEKLLNIRENVSQPSTLNNKSSISMEFLIEKGFV